MKWDCQVFCVQATAYYSIIILIQLISSVLCFYQLVIYEKEISRDHSAYDR